MNDICTDDNDEVLTIISRSIGRTCCVENHIERAKDVVRSLRENDLSLPQPTNVPAPEPVITDERIEKVAKSIYDLRHGEGAFEQEKSWRVSAGIEWRTSEPLFAEARAALVAALGGE